jgi:TPR repeat protein
MADDHDPCVLDAFVCPITLHVMERPVVCDDGYSYEEDAIRRWLAPSSSAARSPMTNQPLRSAALVPNIALRHAIAEWRAHAATHAATQRDLAEAHFWIGWKHHEAKDAAAAARWYAKAAVRNGKAQLLLGCMYHDGDGVTRDPAVSAKWFARAARSGGAAATDAQLRLGHMYRTGAGVTLDLEVARYWYTQAADQGDADAQFALGCMCRATKDAGAQWFRKAAEQGHADAQHAMGALYYYGNTIARFAVAANWYRRAADQGHAESQFELGCMHRDGVGVAKDASAAARLFTLAATAGHADAQYVIGTVCDLDGDHAGAAHWYAQAASAGHARAQFQLDAMFCAL